MPAINPGANFIDNGVNNLTGNSVGSGVNNVGGSSPPPPPTATLMTWADATQVTWGDGTQAEWAGGTGSSPSLDFSQASNSMYFGVII